MKKTLPQMGNTPKVMPRAAENANCFGSAPLRKKKKKKEVKFTQNDLINKLIKYITLK